MARVTKINVGGTNYDIAHEGELKKSGFEVVSSLPTTGLFAGREVMYNGKKYVYSSGWKEEITANTMYEDKLLYNTGIIVPNGSIIDRLMQLGGIANVYAYTKPEAISVQYSQDAGATWADYELSDLDKQNLCTFSKHIYCGGPGVTAGNINYRLRVNLFPKFNGVNIFHKLILTFIYGTAYNRWLTVRCLRKNQEDIDTNYDTIIDKGVISGDIGMMSVNLGNIDMLNTYDKVVLDIGYDSVGIGKGLSLNSLSMYATYSSPANYLAKYGRMYHYDINKNSYFDGAVSSKEIINFDVNNIEPTQTGSSVSKTSTWMWQYLTQAVNWLKANDVRLSAYNTKVAALEQADNTKLDKRAYNQIYTNCGYVNFNANVATGALIIELPFAPNGDRNNSMTYIELNVYSHRKGCSKYIIGVYSYSQNSQFEWSVYSYMGYNYFSKISFGRRTDNNNLVVVLGDFTDVHKYEHFSISNIITGFNRNNDDTDGFLLYTDLDSNNYSILKQSTYNPLIISYNDLTDKPTLFSGSYDDLKNTPTIPSSLADLSGSISEGQIPDGLITNAKLANSSMSLNGTTVNLGDTAILPWYVDYNETDYPARIREHWLQIYRNGVWANLMYLGDILPTQVGQITSLDNLDWYNEQVSEYEVDSSTTISILNGTTLPATLLLDCLAEQLTLNFYPISGKQYGKGSLDSLISDLKGKGFSVFAENDLDTIIGSGSDYLVRLKISKVPTPKAIIECYVAR